MGRSKVALAIVFCSALGFASSFADAQKIYWTSNGIGDHKIVRSDLDGSHIEEFLTQVVPIALAVDPVNGKLYWTGSNDAAFFLGIHRINLDGSNAEDLVPRESPQSQFGIALDVTGGKMYWTQAEFDSLGDIRRADLDGSNVEVLLTGLDDPYGIALDLGAGKMYWTEQAGERVRRADLDGSNVDDLVVGLGAASGIALDLDAGKMYFVAFGIFRADLDGSEIEELVPFPSLAIAGPFAGIGIALDVERDTMYLGIRDLARVDLDGSNYEILLPLIQARASPGIALDLRKPIPAVSEWGLVLFTLSLLTAATLIVLRRPTPRKV